MSFQDEIEYVSCEPRILHQGSPRVIVRKRHLQIYSRGGSQSLDKHSGRSHTESTRHESTTSLPLLYPMKQKIVSVVWIPRTDSMQHTCTWKKTYTSNDRQLQSSHKKIARQNRNVNKTNSSYVN